MVQYEAGTKAIENNTTLDVTLTSGNTKIRTTCTFDIYYEYNQNSSIYGDTLAPVTDASSKELTLKMGGNGTSDYTLEKNFNIDSNWINNSKRLVVKNATISDATTTGTTKSWDISMAFYNLDKDQNKLAGKTFSGTFYVEKDSINCDNEENVPQVSIEALMTPNDTDIFEENGIRYEGADPNNYICLDNKKNGTCSDNALLFRIIGLFDEDTSSDGTNSSGTKKLLKIIDTNNYGGTSGKAWNSGTSTNMINRKNGSKTITVTPLLNLKGNFETKYFIPDACYAHNNWSTASLKTELNGTYLTILTSTSNVNNKLSNAIANTIWHLGGFESNTSTVSQWYIEERNSSSISNGNPSGIYAKVGLMYPSDYGYATVGNNTTNKSSCRTLSFSNWDSSSYSDCKNNDWIYKSAKFVNSSEWLITPTSTNYCYAFSIGTTYDYSQVNALYAVRPTLYLDTNSINIIGTGDGSSSNPYRIG